jgi:hypothetical protein
LASETFAGPNPSVADPKSRYHADEQQNILPLAIPPEEKGENEQRVSARRIELQ